MAQPPSYHIREAVQNPDGGHQVQVNLAHQLLFFFGLLFKRRGYKLGVGIFGRDSFLVMNSILLDVCSCEVANRFGLILPECAIWVVWRHYAKEVVNAETK
jgi:hypothetical protein